MKRLALIVAALLFLAAPAQADGNKIYLYTWSTYVAPDLFAKFEKETGIKVITDVYDSNEALIAKIKAGGTYDVVAPSANSVPIMVAENLLQRLPQDLSAYGAKMTPPLRDPDYDHGHAYSLPLFYGSTGLAVDTKVTHEKIDSWRQYFVRPAGEAPSLGELDEINSVVDIASLVIGKPYCDGTPETLKAMQALLLAQKPFVKTYSATGYIERLTANEVAMQMAWNGDVYKVRQQNPAIQYVYPKEGVELWVDNLAIAKNAPNPEGARKFLAFLMRPENAAAYAVVAGYMPGLDAARDLLPDAMKNAPEFNIPAGLKTGISMACPPPVLKAYSQIWEQLMR